MLEHTETALNFSASTVDFYPQKKKIVKALDTEKKAMNKSNVITVCYNINIYAFFFIDDYLPLKYWGAKNSKITNTIFQYQGKPYAISTCGFNSPENENWENHKYSNEGGNKSVKVWWQEDGKGCADNSDDQAGSL